MYRRLALLIGICLAGVLEFRAAADIVVCADGRTLEGEVEIQGDTVIIKGRFGRVTLRRAEVLEIKKGGSDEEYQKKLDELDKSDKAKDAESHFQLGKWAAEKKMDKQAAERFKRAIEIDPDHEGARAAMGYVKYLGQWVPEDDAMKAKGMIKVGNRWLTKAEADALLAKKDPGPSKTPNPPMDPKKIAPEVPDPMILVNCPTCAGKGFVPGQGDCRRCRASGFMYNDGKNMICNLCAGTGKIGAQCTACGGTGKTWKKKE